MMTVMDAGGAKVVRELADEGLIHGLLSSGGSGGSSVAAPAMQGLPIGFPKLLVSTIASGDVKPYVGEVDSTLTYSVVDVAGINSISELVLGNAAAGIAGMAKTYEARQSEPAPQHTPLIGMTMFGVTTPAADEADEAARPSPTWGTRCWSSTPPAPGAGRWRACRVRAAVRRL